MEGAPWVRILYVSYNMMAICNARQLALDDKIPNEVH